MKNEREKALFLAQLKDFANTLSDKIAVNDLSLIHISEPTRH